MASPWPAESAGAVRRTERHPSLVARLFALAEGWLGVPGSVDPGRPVDSMDQLFAQTVTPAPPQRVRMPSPLSALFHLRPAICKRPAATAVLSL